MGRFRLFTTLSHSWEQPIDVIPSVCSLSRSARVSVMPNAVLSQTNINARSIHKIKDDETNNTKYKMKFVFPQNFTPAVLKHHGSTPSLVESQSEDDESISDCSTVNMSNVTQPKKRSCQNRSLKQEPRSISKEPSILPWNLWCGALDVVYYAERWMTRRWRKRAW